VSVLRFSKFSRFSIFGIFQSSSFRCFVNGGQERSCSAAASGLTVKFHLINHVTRTMAMCGLQLCCGEPLSPPHFLTLSVSKFPASEIHRVSLASYISEIQRAFPAKMFTADQDSGPAPPNSGQTASDSQTPQEALRLPGFRNWDFVSVDNKLVLCDEATANRLRREHGPNIQAHLVKIPSPEDWTAERVADWMAATQDRWQAADDDEARHANYEKYAKMQRRARLRAKVIADSDPEVLANTERNKKMVVDEEETPKKNEEEIRIKKRRERKSDVSKSLTTLAIGGAITANHL